jgi:SpoVK/Ycf46/Vps4 family AAA+-type ATPase
MAGSKIINYLRAGFPAFWLQTNEHDYVQETIYSSIRDFERKDGLKYQIKEWRVSKETPDPFLALTKFNDEPECTIFFMYNMHWFDRPVTTQYIKDNYKLWGSQAKAIVFVSHTKKIPAELEKEFILINLGLPNEEEIKTAVTEISPLKNINPKKINQIINSCKGLSRLEIDSVLALSIVEADGKGFSVETINEHKAQAIRKTGFLDILDNNLTYKNIIGYEQIKRFIDETINNPESKGIMTIGPPGCGKTSLMKAVVGEHKLFGLSVNMGSLFSKYQGETDQNINKTIDIITNIGRCLVLIDEWEKQFAGAASDGSLDSGTTRRATGRWLDFLQNRPKGVYIVGTANSFSGIPNEYLRPGRWDTSPFFIDYPTKTVAYSILEHYCKKKGIKSGQQLPDLDLFSGAEIEALVHIASMRNISLVDAAETIIPQAKTMKESIENLREWAKDRTIPAEQAIIKKQAKQIKRRKIDT